MTLTRIRLDRDEEAGRVRALLERSVYPDSEVERAVAEILRAVRTRGDEAVRELTERFDDRSPIDGTYEIPEARWQRLVAAVAPEIRTALKEAAARIRGFHEPQVETGYEIEEGGIRLALRVDPLARVGIYVPGGTARYPSSVLMTAIPARVAGVGEIVMVTPGASAETLAAAHLAGVDRVFEIGGAQAVAALAYGTDTVPQVDKIVGPGNQWVAEAKRQLYGTVDIDSVAGPSEVLIIADDSANPRWVAADLLAQAEHDVEARPVLVTVGEALIDAVDAELAQQLKDLPRAEIARTAIARHGVAVVAADRRTAVAFANRYAPEHLGLHIHAPREVLGDLRNSGAIFVGHYSSEATGDYFAGPNHVLPTGGAARYASPLGVYDFRKRTSVVEYGRDALIAHADAIARLAEVEGLEAHSRSVRVRLDSAEVTGASGASAPAGTGETAN